MRTKYQRLRIFTIFFLSVIMLNCTKDVAIPSTHVEKLYGSWNWVQSSGGFAGLIETPLTAGYTQKIDFNRTGVFTTYKNGILITTMNFTLTEGISILNSVKVYLIKYKTNGSSSNNYNRITQSIVFGGQDSLYLYDECFDCYSYIYTKQK